MDATIKNTTSSQNVAKKEKHIRQNKEKQVNIRLTIEQYENIKRKMKNYNFASMGEYFRFVGLNAIVTVNMEKNNV
jgi:hypothetical protein